MILLLLLLYFVGIVYGHAQHHECIHDSIQRLTPVSVERQVYPDVSDDDADSITKKRATTTVRAEPIRVHFDYSNIGTGPESCRDGVASVVVQNVKFTCDPMYFFVIFLFLWICVKTTTRYYTTQPLKNQLVAQLEKIKVSLFVYGVLVIFIKTFTMKI